MDDMERVINALKRCISADMTCEGCPYEGTTCTTTLNTDVLNLLRDFEPVKHGHWIDKPTGRYGNWQSYCSACGKHNQIGGTDSNRHKPRCPWCGAYMDEVSE